MVPAGLTFGHEALRIDREARVGEPPLVGLGIPVSQKLIDLEGKEKRALVVWFERGGTTWFFKMVGPTKLVGSQKAKFEEFMKSVQFPGGGE